MLRVSQIPLRPEIDVNSFEDAFLTGTRTGARLRRFTPNRRVVREFPMLKIRLRLQY